VKQQIEQEEQNNKLSKKKRKKEEHKVAVSKLTTKHIKLTRKKKMQES